MIKSVETVITPDAAYGLLQQNNINRKISQRTVDIYARDMVTGRWRKNGEPIIIDWNDDIISGQHRLWACIQAGVPFQTMLTTGIDPDVRPTVDTGRKRTVGDAFYINKIPNYSVAASCLRVIVSIRQNRVNVRLSTQESFDLLSQHNERIARSAEIGKKCRNFLEPSIGAALHFLFSEKSSEGADTFFDILATGQGLKEKHPILVLREKLVRDKLSRQKFNPADKIGMAIRAWSLWRLGMPCNKLQVLRPDANGSIIYPDII